MIIGMAWNILILKWNQYLLKLKVLLISLFNERILIYQIVMEIFYLVGRLHMDFLNYAHI